MTQHIIDTDELSLQLARKIMQEVNTHTIPVDVQRMPQLQAKIQVLISEAIANSPQADGMVLVPTEPTKEMMEAVWIAYLNRQGDIDFEESAIDFYKAMLSAYKPQADDVPPDVYDIVVDTGDGIYHTAEVVHFQQSGSKRMIQVRLGEPQADDVRKDADTIALETAGIIMDIIVDSFNNPPVQIKAKIQVAIREAIDKARA